MENRLPIPEGADIAEDAAQYFTGVKGVLPHPVATVGIGAYGDDFAAQLMEPAEEEP